MLSDFDVGLGLRVVRVERVRNCHSLTTTEPLGVVLAGAVGL